MSVGMTPRYRNLTVARSAGLVPHPENAHGLGKLGLRSIGSVLRSPPGKTCSSQLRELLQRSQALVFVAVSVNIDRILKFKGLRERALQAVLLLLSVVLVSIIGGACYLARVRTRGGMIFAIAGAVGNAWVLMVEIRR